MFDIVGGQGIAGKQHVDVTGSDQPTKKLAAAGMHDRRPGHQKRLPGRTAVAEQPLGDVVHSHALRFLRGDVAGHELEAFRASGLFFREHTQPGMADDHLIARADFAHRATSGQLLADVYHDPTVHLLIVHSDPLPAETQLGSLVCGAVKLFGKGPADVGRGQTTILGDGRHGPVVGYLGQDLIEFRSVVGADFDQGMAPIAGRLADLDLLDTKRAAVMGDAVEHLRQNQAVDDVAGKLDVLDLHTDRRLRCG